MTREDGFDPKLRMPVSSTLVAIPLTVDMLEVKLAIEGRGDISALGRCKAGKGSAVFEASCSVIRTRDEFLFEPCHSIS